jgi:hypothetical protein
MYQPTRDTFEAPEFAGHDVQHHCAVINGNTVGDARGRGGERYSLIPSPACHATLGLVVCSIKTTAEQPI